MKRSFRHQGESGTIRWKGHSSRFLFDSLGVCDLSVVATMKMGRDVEQDRQTKGRFFLKKKKPGANGRARFPQIRLETYLVTLKILNRRRALSTLMPKEVPGFTTAQMTSKMLPTITCTKATGGGFKTNTHTQKGKEITSG